MSYPEQVLRHARRIERAIEAVPRMAATEAKRWVEKASPVYHGWYRAHHHATGATPDQSYDITGNVMSKRGNLDPTDNDVFFLSNPAPHAIYVENGGKNTRAYKLYARISKGPFLRDALKNALGGS